MYMNANSYSSSSKGIIHLIEMLICSKILTQTETASPRLNILTQRQHSSDYGIGDFRGDFVVGFGVNFGVDFGVDFWVDFGVRSGVTSGLASGLRSGLRP